MVRWLSRFFNYLDRYYTNQVDILHVVFVLVAILSDQTSTVAVQVLHPQTFLTLPERCGTVALQRFAFWTHMQLSVHVGYMMLDINLAVSVADDVYSDMKRKARDAILQLIELEREGEQIDRTLLKNILGIFQEVGMGQMTCYQQDFEAQLLKTTAEYYKRKAAVWIEEDSCPDYMVYLSTTCCQPYNSDGQLYTACCLQTSMSYTPLQPKLLPHMPSMMHFVVHRPRKQYWVGLRPQAPHIV